METGIYTITCLSNNRIYVGSTSTDFHKRKLKHLTAFRNGKAPNKYLQRAWDKYGEENFIFEILEECEAELCISLETYWITILNTTNRNFGYNIHLPIIGWSGQKHSEESKQKISKALRGKKRKPLSDEHKEKVRLTSIGRLKSAETREKISKSKIGKPRNQETKDKLSKSHTGKILTEEHKKNIGLAVKKWQSVKKEKQ